MRYWWWKIGSMILLLYVLVVSLMTPLSPGVVQVSQSTVVPGFNSIEIAGYNTHFSDNISVWATNGAHEYCATNVEVLTGNSLIAEFNFEGPLSDDFFHLLVNNNTDGTMFYPEAFYGRGFEVQSGSGSATPCSIPIATTEYAAFSFPNRSVLYETIRNLMFHVPMWFAMFFLMGISVVQGVRYLGNGNLNHDLKAEQSVRVGLLFSVLGLISGSIWARFTWGAWWVSDPQLNGAAVTFLMYVAYLILRNSIDDLEKRGRVSAVYNIFAFAMLVVLLLVLPRFTDSLHPGKGGNPAFSKYDLDSTLRGVFYPAVVGWILLGYWIYTVRYRMAQLQKHNES